MTRRFVPGTILGTPCVAGINCARVVVRCVDLETGEPSTEVIAGELLEWHPLQCHMLVLDVDGTHKVWFSEVLEGTMWWTLRGSDARHVEEYVLDRARSEGWWER